MLVVAAVVVLIRSGVKGSAELVDREMVTGCTAVSTVTCADALFVVSAALTAFTVT
jgi:hypothetical protein